MHASEETEPLIQLGAEVASSDYWLPRIRFKGGAYGARIGHDRYNAVWDLMSYADPDFRKTWQAFHEMSAEFEKLDLSRERLDQLVISALRPDINPLKPEQAGHAALSRFLLGETSEYRSRRYAAMRAASPENVKKAVKEHLEKNGASASFCVVGGPDQVKSASECSPDRFVRLEPLSS
jgi:Zn-dependent M16 (insulinase) family peptidase